jgi:hypothetical protein
MICFCHSGNSFNKEQFYKYKTSIKLKNLEIIKLLEDISGIKYNIDKSDSEDENE